ncbi:unnamed protein product [Acanthoscelides obtectus]|nr:unnamed protein product [Acanthoscelides obtectus]CAK1649963.1 Clavesin-1 [Acanthoscelides obtectus]
MADAVPYEESRLKCSVDTEEPSDDLLEWARENIGEDPDTKELRICELRDMIFERGECTPDRTDDDFLLRFLRARHFIVPKAHRLLVNYCNFKESRPEYFENVDVNRMRELAKTLILSVPPYKDQHGRRMMFLRIGSWKSEEFTIPELFQLAIGILEMSVLEPKCQIKGGVFIVDLGDISLNLAWYLTPSLAKDLMALAMTSFPMRLEEVHFIFSSWVFDTAWSIFKPLLPDTVKARIYFHGDDLDSLHNQMEPKYLPKRYGGIHFDYPLDVWFEDVLLKDERILDVMAKLGYEQLRRLKEEISKASD